MNNKTATVTIGKTTFDVNISVSVDYRGTLGSLNVVNVYAGRTADWGVELPAEIFDPKTEAGKEMLKAIKFVSEVEFDGTKRNTRKSGRIIHSLMDVLLVGTNRAITVRIAREGYNQWDADQTAQIQAEIDAERDAEALRKIEAIEIFKGYAEQGIRIIEAEIETASGLVYRVTAHRWSNESNFRYEAWAINSTGHLNNEIALGKTQYPSNADLADLKAKADQFAVAVMC